MTRSSAPSAGAGRPVDDLALVRDLPKAVAISVGGQPPIEVRTAIAGADLHHDHTSCAELAGYLDSHARVVLAVCRPSDDTDASFDRLIDSIRVIRSSSPRGRILLLADDPSSDQLVRALRAGVNDVLDQSDVFALQRTITQQVSAAQSRRDRVLVVGAHPDDVEIGAAGTLLDHHRRGDAITVLTLSRGAIGGDTTARVGESTAAAERMGARLFLGNQPDTAIDPGSDTIRFIENVVDLVDPTVLYVHSCHDGHQDHRAVHIATMSATRRVPRVYCFQSPSGTNEFLPTRFVSIDDMMTGKLEVLAEFNSQKERTYLEPELVVAQARYWARSLAPRARYAEAFEVMRDLGDQFPSTRVNQAESGLATVTALRR